MAQQVRSQLQMMLLQQSGPGSLPLSNLGPEEFLGFFRKVEKLVLDERLAPVVVYWSRQNAPAYAMVPQRVAGGKTGGSRAGGAGYAGGRGGCRGCYGRSGGTAELAASGTNAHARRAFAGGGIQQPSGPGWSAPASAGDH